MLKTIVCVKFFIFFLPYSFSLNCSQTFGFQKLKVLEVKLNRVTGQVIFFSNYSKNIVLHYEECNRLFYKCEDFSDKLFRTIPSICKGNEGFYFFCSFYLQIKISLKAGFIPKFYAKLKKINNDDCSEL